MIKRPILIITICYIISILWGIYLKKYISLFCFLLFVINIFFYISKKKNAKKCNFIFLNICILIIFIGTNYIRYRDDSYYNFKVDDNIVNAIVVIDEVKQDSDYYYNYVAKVIQYNNKKDKPKFYLKIPKKVASRRYKYGDVLHVNGTFEKGEVRRNYKGFSYFNYLKTKNIYGILKCENVEFLKEMSTNVYNMWINNLRDKLRNNLTQLIPKGRTEIASALLLGDSEEITNNQQKVFSDANLSHILAISGMHVSFVILGVSFLLKRVSKRASKYVFIIFLIIFASLTGASPSVIRAVIMSILTLVAGLIYRKSDTINNIAISALVILFFNPYNIFNLGFQLSFLGTLGIVLFHSRIYFKLINVCYAIRMFNINKMTQYKRFQNTIKIMSVSISANILIFPILIYNFNTISFVFIISNLLVTPILTALIFSGYIAIILSIISIKISILPAKLFNFMIGIFCKIAEFCANIKWLKFVIGTPKVYTIVIIYLLIGIVYFSENIKNFFRCNFAVRKFQNSVYKYITKKHIKIIIVFIFVLSILLRNLNLYNKKFTIHLVDVGQGDCTLIVTSTNKTILIDGGGSESKDYDVGDRVVVPYLLDRQIKTIDYMIFSHFDSDHCLGLFSVIKEIRIKVAVISEQCKVSSNYKYFIELVKEKRS